MILRCKAFPRAALVGNPSDGYFGKTIAFVFHNYCAEAELYESPELDLTKVPHTAGMSDAEILFSESNSRFLVSCRPEKAAELEKALAGFTFAKVGKTNGSGIRSVKGTQADFSIPLETLIESYKKTLAGV